MESFSRLRAFSPDLASLALASLAVVPLLLTPAFVGEKAAAIAAPNPKAEVPEGIVLDADPAPPGEEAPAEPPVMAEPEPPAEAPAVTPPAVTPPKMTPIEAPDEQELELEFSTPEAVDNPADDPADDPKATSEPPSAEEAEERKETQEENSLEEPAADGPTVERVFLADDQISFAPPQGFTPMSEAEIERKFPGSMPPQFAYANDRRNVSIGISLSDTDLAPEQLPEVRQFLESFLADQVPGFEWVARDYATLGGNRWIKLEFISRATDTQIHNDLYITSFKGKLLGFNFNSILSMEEDLRPELRNSRDSIVLNPSTTARN